jgi:F420-dependent oxidoreductase-like protein
VKLSTALPSAANLPEVTDRLIALERAGLDTVWIPEAYGFDSPTLMGYLAAKTETVEIASSILNIYSRTPAALAQTAAGLDHVSGGRAVLGLGASGPQVIEGWHGLPYKKPLARTRDVVEIIRQALRRDVVTHEGSAVSVPLPEGEGVGLGKPLKLMDRPVRSAVPIYLAALGEKNVELAAEIADGWKPTLFVPDKAQDVWGPSVARGQAKRQDGLGPLQIVAGGLCAIGDDVGDLVELNRPKVALYVGGMGARGQNFYNRLMCEYGYEKEAGEIQDLYLEGRKDEAAAAVPRRVLELMNLIGPESYVKERVEAFREAGVTNLSISPVGPEEPAVLLRRMREIVG